MNSVTRRSALAGIGAAALAVGRSKSVLAANKYDVGVTDSEIKLGTTSPYSGPASAYGIYGQAQSAYFEMVNDRGGINGRKVNLISLDNAFSPPKAVEQTRKLVESDEVFAIAGFLGTPPNAAVSKYLNGKGSRACFSPPERCGSTIQRIFPGSFHFTPLTSPRARYSADIF